MERPILELREITKAFGSKIANRNIDLTILPGTVHAIVGENGAGKSTLMNMISGNLQPDTGEIIVDGRAASITDPRAADALGIGMVHQHFKLVPSLSVAENIFLGKERTAGPGVLDRRAMEAQVAELSEGLGLRLNPRDRVQDLSVGERQRVEIVKALSHDTRLLILDEPTAVLTPAETDELFVVIRQLVERGCAVLFISHKLGEVLSIADQLTVIRDGEVVGNQPVAGLTQQDVAAMMVGRDVLLRVQLKPAVPAESILEVEELTALDHRGAIAVDGLSLSVRSGEIVGIAGVEGNGQAELAAAIAGMQTAARGRVNISGRDATRASVALRRSLGLAYIPEDRHEEGSAPSLSVAENIAAGHLRPPLTRRGWLAPRVIAAFAARLIARFDIRGAHPDTPIGSLSGGNMQKVIIARELESAPSLLVVAQPTRGVDVGAMEFVHNSIIALRDRGTAVLLISADLNEVMSLSDRLLVMYRGRVVAEFTQADMTEVAVGLAMAGTPPTAAALKKAQLERNRIDDELGIDRHHNEVIANSPSGPSTAPELDESGAESPPPPEEPPHAPSSDINASLSMLAARAFTNAGQPVIAVIAALAIGALVILAIGENPITAYVQLFTSGWRTPFGIGSIIAMFVPLAIMAAGTIISFRAGFFNIGGEGQLYLGAFAGALAGFSLQGVPPLLHITLVLAAGALAGAAWGLIPGWLTGFLKVDIIVITLLLSQVALLITSFLVTGPFADPTATLAGSPKIESSAALPRFSDAFGFGPDLFIALVIAVGLGLVLQRTAWGLRAKALGERNRFADYLGNSSRRMALQVMSISGAAAGVAGALFVIGPSGGRFLQAFSPGFAFLAITVALLARLNPWASLLAALFYATMMAGGTGIQAAGVPFPMISILQGLIVIAITATIALNFRRRRHPATAAVVPEASRHRAPGAQQ